MDNDFTESDKVAGLVGRAQSGDPEAYDEIILLYQDLICQQMRRFSRDQQDVEELTQNVFVSAYLSLKNYRRQAPFINWLRTIASRCGYAFWREQYKQARMQPLGSWDAVDYASAQAEHDAKDRLEALLGRLRPAERHVLYLLHIDDYTVSEAAEITGWTEGMVKMRAHRARNKLRALLCSDTDIGES